LLLGDLRLLGDGGGDLGFGQGFSHFEWSFVLLLLGLLRAEMRAHLSNGPEGGKGKPL
jgi:hypothetical protein